MKKFDLYQEITNKIVSELEKGTVPWSKPWSNFGLPKNYATGREYTGINTILLSLAPYEVPYYMTFKQATSLGGKIKKGAKTEIVTYMNQVKTKEGTEEGTEEGKTYFFMKYYRVFNIQDIEGLKIDIPELLQNDNEKLLLPESIVNKNQNPRVVHENLNEAYYSPLRDTINMPNIGQFKDSESYYKVLFHELIHSTGHRKRLNREGITGKAKFGSPLYSKEELIAEIGASYLCAKTNINPNIEQSASYIENWLTVLKKDKKLIFTAASQAQKASDYLTN